jgi:hypothetical protein
MDEGRYVVGVAYQADVQVGADGVAKSLSRQL